MGKLKKTLVRSFAWLLYEKSENGHFFQILRESNHGTPPSLTRSDQTKIKTTKLKMKNLVRSFAWFYMRNRKMVLTKQ